MSTFAGVKGAPLRSLLGEELTSDRERRRPEPRPADQVGEISLEPKSISRRRHGPHGRRRDDLQRCRIAPTWSALTMTRRNALSDTCVYSSVVARLAWPRRRWMYLMSTPASMSRVAAV